MEKEPLIDSEKDDDIWRKIYLLQVELFPRDAGLNNKG